MVKQASKVLLLVTLALALLAACTQQPVYNVEAFPVSVNISLDDIEKAILTAGTRRGWRMTAVSPGMIEGQLIIREHMALVEIPYSSQQYSIHYKDSSGLGYSDGSIHRNYNLWVRNLEKSINQEIIRQSN